MDENNQEKVDAEVQSGDETTAESQADKVDRQAFEDQKKRAEKLERELKELREAQQSRTEGNSEKPAQANLTQEQIRLIAKYSEAEYDKLQRIANAEGVSLSEAESGDLFNLWRKNEEQKRKQEQAQLRASKGGRSAQEKKTISTPGLTKEEHKALWKEKMGR